MSLKIIIFGIATIVTLGVITYLSISAYIAYRLTMPEASPILKDKSIIGRGTDVTFKSKDNLPLAGWYFPGSNGKAIMFVHGAGRQNRYNEYYGTEEIAKYFLDKGYAILLFDLRGSGESVQTRMSFGLYESNDVTGAFDYLKRLDFPEKSIGIISDSLGAIATILAANTVKDAGAVVLDSPATEVSSPISIILEHDHHIPRFLHPGIFFWEDVLYKIDVYFIKPVDYIPEMALTPILFIHGEKDTLIPPVNTEILLSKVQNASRIVFPNAEHVLTYKSDKEKYLQAVSDFFLTNLK